MTTTTRPRLTRGGVDPVVLVPTLLLIAAEVWFLATRAQSVLIPLIWMAPMDLFLLVYAVDETLALSEVAIVLLAARLLFLPILLVARLNSLLLFYALFMAPVDVLIVAYAIRAAGRRLGSSATPT
ncbi:MAG: hypothetical protein ABEJ31_03375 [Haloarculaceae archaeon]